MFGIVLFLDCEKHAAKFWLTMYVTLVNYVCKFEPKAVKINLPEVSPSI